ncbi:MAG: phosphatase PAP2 family protein [Pseudomonadota bacterium]
MRYKSMYFGYFPWFALLVGVAAAAALYDGRLVAVMTCFTDAHPGFAYVMRLITDWGNYVFYAGFGVALAVGLIRRDAALVRLGLAYFFTLLIFSLLVGHAVKILWGRPRPFLGAEMPCRPLSFEADHNSFPSGHTSDAFSAVVPSRRWLGGGRILQVVVPLWAMVIALSRIFLGQHYPTDVLGGIALGLGGGFLVMRVVDKRWAFFGDTVKVL